MILKTVGDVNKLKQFITNNDPVIIDRVTYWLDTEVGNFHCAVVVKTPEGTSEWTEFVAATPALLVKATKAAGVDIGKAKDVEDLCRRARPPVPNVLG